MYNFRMCVESSNFVQNFWKKTGKTPSYKTMFNFKFFRIMKKIFTFVALAAMAMVANAQYECNNPVGEDGRYIVKYDCAKGAFAASNDIMADEAFVFAIDIKGTWLENWVKGTPETQGASRGVACNFWTNYGDVDGNIRRFKQINGTIYGMTLCLSQAMVNPTEAPKAVMKDSVVYVYGQVFGFEYTADNAGAKWWQWDGNPEGLTHAPLSDDALFASLPFAAGRASEDFYANDFDEDMFGMDSHGYAAPCVLNDVSAVEHAKVEAKSAKFIENGQLYIISNGVKFNALGTVVK